jgi:hypothetical protein
MGYEGIAVGRLTSAESSLTLQKSRAPQLQGVQGFGCNRLRPILDNEEDVVSSAFPEGKQLGCSFRLSGCHLP